MKKTISFSFLHCFRYSQSFQMKGIGNYFVYFELQPIIPSDINALTLCSHRELLHMYDATHLINILQFLLQFQATFRCLVGLLLPQTKRHKRSFLCYPDEVITEQNNFLYYRLCVEIYLV